MAERNTGKQDMGKGKASSDGDQTMADSERKQSGSSAIVLPFKKRRAGEANIQQDSEPQANTTAPSTKGKETNVADDRSERNPPGPGSRVLSREQQHEAFCLSKTLQSSDVIQEKAELYLDPHEASLLTKCNEILDIPHCSFSENFLMFDGEDRRYNMVLSQYSKGGAVGYFLGGDWKRFVNVHRLKAGDEMTFYRIFDKNVSDDHYHILKYFRRPADPTDCAPKRNKKLVIRNKKVYRGSDKMEDKPKQTALEVDKVPVEKAGVSSDKLEKSEVEKNASTPTAWPSHRILSDEDYRLSKTLTSIDVASENPMLHLDAYEASVLTDSPSLMDSSLGLPSSNLLVYGTDDSHYDMLLSPHTRGEWTGYTLSGDWELYLNLHDLAAGDVVTFYRIFDRVISNDGHYYILTYSRKCDDAPSETNPSGAGLENFMVEDRKELQQTVVETKGKRVPEEKPPDRTAGVVVLGPGSRAMVPQDYLITKTLGSDDVIPENPKLHLNAHEAMSLTDTAGFTRNHPGSFSKNLLVFDGEDRRYNMMLAHHISRGLIGFSVAGDWNRFVRTHNLEAGDEITFYKILDEGVSDDYYYVIRCLKKPRERKRDVVTPGTSSKKPSDDRGKDSKLKGKLKTRRFI